MPSTHQNRYFDERAQFISELVAGFRSAWTSFLSPNTGHDIWIAFVLIGFCRHESLSSFGSGTFEKRLTKGVRT